MVYYNKLVRDRISEIMREKGEVPHLETLDDAAYRRELLKKLDEEVAEYKESGETEEVLKNPKHPYTKALIACIPKLGNKREKLQSINYEEIERLSK